MNLSIPGTRARESFNLQAHIPDFKKLASPKDGNSADFRRFFLVSFTNLACVFHGDEASKSLPHEDPGPAVRKYMRIGRYLVLIILFVGFFIIFGNRGLLDNQRLKEKLFELRAENSRIEAVNSGLKREVVLMREDLRYIESVARNELGMVKRGDFIYRFVEPTGKREEPTTPPQADGSGQPSQEPIEDTDPNPAARPNASI